ncbi:MAG: glycosyltransferase family 4 protein [Elioraea sp.]|nr:glycosyltransferase family 4 protein [Elioraea sp.]
MNLVVNGRFLVQAVTGVQRVARELVAAADLLAAEGRWPATRLVAPPGARLPALRTMAAGTTGPLFGQAWEQVVLPVATGGGWLLNLGNTAPLAAGARQTVLIHDAGAFDTPGSYSMAFRTWYRLLQRTLARFGARIVTVSNFSRGRIAAALRLDPATIPVIPEGAEHILREPADLSVLARNELVPGRYVLAVGTGAQHKNLSLLAAARGLLAERGLALAVAGRADPSVFRRAGALEGAISLGRVTDGELRALYEHAAALLFPSRYEGFGLPPLEAMACGCPVIAGAAGAVPEIVGEDAILFPPDDARALVTALDRLIGDPDLARRLREGGRRRAARFTWRAAAEALRDTLPEEVR